MESYKITFKIVRSFSLGFAVYSPKLNGLCFDINFACFHLGFWNRGKKLIGFGKLNPRI
jgi:hypothetical protein